MKFAIFHVGADPEYERIFKVLIRSIRETHPDSEIWHLTDCETPSVKENGISLADRELRITQRMPLMTARAAVMTYFDGDVVRLDTDIVVKQNLEHLFSLDFDVAAVRRRGKYRVGKNPIGKPMPYNSGVIFTRNKQVWKDYHAHLLTLPKNEQQWFGDQFALAAVIKSGKYKVLELDRSYNYTPGSRDEDVSEKMIVHYKGKRKEWM